MRLEKENKRERQTIIYPHMNSYSFDRAVNEALNDGFKIIRLDIHSRLCAVLMKGE